MSLSKRDVIWSEIRKQRDFSVRQLHLAVAKTCSERIVRTYLKSLCAANYLSNSDNRYHLISDCGVDAPRVRPDGTPVLRGCGHENMWRTMKILKTFSWYDVMVVSTTDEVIVRKSTAQHYVTALHRAGYLTLIKSAQPNGVRAIYRLNRTKNTGNRPPIIQRDRSVYDPNLGRVVYTKEAVV